MNKVIITVDAGGSKTQVALINEFKEIVYSITLGSGSPAVVGEDALKTIEKGIKLVYKKIKSPYKLSGIGMGISGLSVITNVDKISLEFERKYNVPIVIENDASIALYSVIGDSYDKGILVLSGTGSAVFGVNKNETILVGGYGHLLTEVGSAYMVVRDFINQSIKRFESEQINSPLTQKFFDLIDITSVHGFRSFVYNNTKREIASYAKFIVEEANNKDVEAITLLKKAGRDLATDVINAYKALNLKDEVVVGFRGGFINNAKIVQDELLSSLKEDGLKFKYVIGDLDPIYGVYYKMKKLKLI